MNGYQKLELLLKDKNAVINIFKKHSIGCPNGYGLNNYCNNGCDVCWEKSLNDKYRASNPNRRVLINGFTKMRHMFNTTEETIKFIVDNTKGCPSHYGLKNICNNGCINCWEKALKSEYE